MKVKGDEPAIAGYTDEDAFKWCIESIEACLPAAEKAGVILALENHWGLTTRPENLLRIYKAVKSPWLGINLDTGNFATDPYAGLELLPRTPSSSRPRRITAAGSGTRSTSTTRASRASCARPASTATSRSRWKARRRRTPRWPRAWTCCGGLSPRGAPFVRLQAATSTSAE
jgi:hypothetical protein